MSLDITSIIAENLTGSTVHVTNLTTPSGSVGDVKTMIDSKLDTTGLTSVQLVTKEPTGFPNRTDSTFSFDESNRTFTLSATSTSFDYYRQGTKHTIVSATTLQIPDTTGKYFIYLDETETLGYATDFTLSVLNDKVFTSLVYWNATTNKATILADERHGLTMDWATHFHLHNSFGTRYYGGFGISYLTLSGDGSLNTDATISLGGGRIADEDIEFTIVDSATPSNFFEQELSPIAQIPVMYATGATSEWSKDVATDYPLYFSNGRVHYNALSGLSRFALSSVTDGYYVASWIFAITDVNSPIVAIMGNREDSTLENCKQNNTYEDIDFSSIPSQEFKVLYRLIYQCNSGYTNAIKARLVDVVDLRGSIDQSLAVSSTQSSQSHSNLFNLNSDDHLQYLTEGRGDNRYYTKTFLDSDTGKFDKTGGTISGDITVTGNSVLNSLTATTVFSGNSNLNTIFAPIEHTHPISAITGLQTALDSKVDNTTFTAYTSTTNTTINGKLDTIVFTAYTSNTLSQLNNKADLSGATFTGNVSIPTLTASSYYSGSTLLQDIFANINHVHAISAITGLQATLNNKADLSGATFTGQITAPIISATSISATTYYGDGSNLTGIVSGSDTYVTGGTYSAGTTTFYNNTGGSFTVVGYFSGLTIGAISGTNQTISSGDLITFSASSGLTSVLETNRTVVYKLDIQNTPSEPSPTTGDKLLLYDTSTGLHKNIDWNQLPGSGGGEANTASNVGGGIGIFKQKTGVDLEFRSLSAGTNITITTGDTLTINANGGSSRITSTVQTTNATPTELEKIDTLTDNATNIIEVFVKAYSSGGAQWGVWKRTLTVTKVSGTVTIREENADVDKQSTGLRATSVSFSVNGGDIDVDVTGIAATTIDWESAYEIIL